ncbi:hypothetical protein R5W24_000580 [Gemmata sp. JC717]|uniref:hypothetical protein n=1 Tax=Gemmata algarum TaxID=2975278 RepID=UPI0021BBB682|nr:hypothetical protein [Gemmata algarum]MDY3551502.1 hypothetical protein [Gemmata algarum]
MAIPVECPVCAEELNIPDKHAGKTVKCPHCLGAVRVPSNEPDEPEEPEEDDALERPRRRPRPPKRRAKPRRASGLLVGLAVVAVLLAAAGAAVLMVQSGKKGGSPAAVQKTEDGTGFPVPVLGGAVPLVGPVRPPLPAGWGDFRHPRGEYSVYVPRQPRLLPRTREFPLNFRQEQYTTDHAKWDGREPICGVEAITCEPELMEMFRTGNVDMSAVSQVFPWAKATSNRIQWNGRVAIEATHEEDLGGAVGDDLKKKINISLKHTLYRRYIVVGDRLYMFGIATPGGQPTEAERRVFFESVVFGR